MYATTFLLSFCNFETENRFRMNLTKAIFTVTLNIIETFTYYYFISQSDAN